MAYENGLLPHDFKKNGLVRPGLSHSAADAALAFNERVKLMMKSGRNVAHFASCQSPFPVPDALKDKLCSYAWQNLCVNSDGIPQLRSAIASFHLREDNVRMDPSNLIVGPGANQLLSLVVNLFDGVIFVQSPSWTSYEALALLSGKSPRVLVTHKAHGWKVTPEVILEGIDHLDSISKHGNKLLILSNPGSPVGCCYTAKELTELSDCCRSNQVIILSDEIYARLAYGKKHASMAKFYPEGTIITTGFGEWASVAGWRIGYAYIPPPLNVLYESLRSYATHTFTCAPVPMQFAMAEVLTHKETELQNFIEDCTTILNIVADYCYRELTSVGITGHPSEAGYCFMPNFEVIRKGLKKRGILSSKQMTKAMLEEADVALMYGEAFLRPSYELSACLSFTCFDGCQTLPAYQQKWKNGVSRKEERERFLRQNCKSLVDGIQRLKDWVLEHKH